MAETRYRVFVSYSHRDRHEAQWLWRALERYRTPRRLVHRATPQGSVPAHLRPCFLDDGELPASADLPATIEEALARSDKLLVVCSPHAAESRWVNAEVQHFVRRAPDAIRCWIIDGSPQPESGELPCFPLPLRETEPAAVDVRPKPRPRRPRSRLERVLRSLAGAPWLRRRSFLRLVASLIGVPPDELIRRHVQRARLRAALLATVLVALGLATRPFVADYLRARADAAARLALTSAGWSVRNAPAVARSERGGVTVRALEGRPVTAAALDALARHGADLDGALTLVLSEPADPTLLAALAGLGPELLEGLEVPIAGFVDDASPLSALRSLGSLSLSGGGLRELAFLTELGRLHTLRLAEMRELRDLSSLKALTDLRHVRLERCAPDLALDPLASLDPESVVLAGVTELESFAFARGYTRIARLEVSGAFNLQDLSALEGLPLTSVTLAECFRVEDLDVLGRLGGLVALELHELAFLEDIGPLAALRELERLTLLGSPSVSSLEPLRGLANLRALHLDCDGVADLGPLGGLALETLDLTGLRAVGEFAPLAGSGALTSLSLRGIERLDLRVLGSQAGLRQLHLEDVRQLTRLDHVVRLPLEELVLARVTGDYDLSVLGASSIERLVLTGLPTTAEDLAQLRAILPDVRLFATEFRPPDWELPALEDD